MPTLDVEESIDPKNLPNFRIDPNLALDTAQHTAYQQPATPNSTHDGNLPYTIAPFVRDLLNALKANDAHSLMNLYEVVWNRIAARHFKHSPPPKPHLVEPHLAEAPLAALLYRELYYRELYSNFNPHLEERQASFDNYCALFDTFVAAPEPLALALPPQWLWDIVDEFIYQFSAQCQLRHRLHKLSPAEIERLKASPGVWDAEAVIGRLRALADKAPYGVPKESQSAFSASSLHGLLGYYALIGLCRVHTILGDYSLALDVLAPVDLGQGGLLTRVAACFISACYYIGFCYLMCRRYVDATRVFAQALFYVARTKQYQTRATNYSEFLKKSEQIHALFAISHALCPQPKAYEHKTHDLSDKVVDRIKRLRQSPGNVSLHEDLFSFACPKFVSPALPEYDQADAEPATQKLFRRQLRIFLDEVRSKRMHPELRSYLKLYKSITIKKLGELLDMDESALREQLLCLKRQNSQLVWPGAGAPLEGTMQVSSVFDFHMDGDTAKVVDTAERRQHADFFLRQINKLEDIVSKLKMVNE